MVFWYVKGSIPQSEKKVDPEYIERELAKLAPMQKSEKCLVGLFLTLVICWFAPGFLSEIWGKTWPISELD